MKHWKAIQKKRIDNIVTLTYCIHQGSFSTSTRSTLYTDRDGKSIVVFKLPNDEYYCQPYQSDQNKEIKAWKI